MKFKIYYAHPIESYGTNIEKEDLKKISEFMDEIFEKKEEIEIVNPSDKEIQEKFEKWKKEEKTEEDHDMRFFKKIVEGCDGMVFRGGTPGVKYEINKAKEFDLPIIDILDIYEG